jgi:mRNA interferase MazF
VIGDDSIGRLPSKTILPITGWNELYEQIPWMVKCTPNDQNNLSKLSAIDAFQIRNLSKRRFVKKLGGIDNELLWSLHQVVVKTLSTRYRLEFD